MDDAEAMILPNETIFILTPDDDTVVPMGDSQPTGPGDVPVGKIFLGN